MNIFKLLKQACGLSNPEAADFLGVSLGAVNAWMRDHRTPPDRILEKLATLAAKIDTAADEGLDEIDRQVEKHGSAPEAIELGLATDDHDAQSIGWPCVGAHAAALGLLVVRGMAEGYKFEIVPRGSTVATAAAADRHE